MPDKRLIDANALKEKLQADHDFYVNAWGGFKNLPTNDKARVDELTASIAAVVNAPTIDAVEVVHAMWIREPRGVVRCSYCDKGYRLTNGGANVLKFFYCPNCGKKMDGGQYDNPSD